MAALWEALDARRKERGLTWSDVAREIRGKQAASPAGRAGGHPFSVSTLTELQKRTRHSCHHVLWMVIWLDRSPESFLAGYEGDRALPSLPPVRLGRVLRWDLKALRAALDVKRRDEGLSWAQLARHLGVGQSQLTGLPKAVYGAAIETVMSIVSYLGRPSSEFMRFAEH